MSIYRQTVCFSLGSYTHSKIDALYPITMRGVVPRGKSWLGYTLRMPQPPVKKYEEIEHTADWALRVRGADLPALFSNAALGMMELAGVRTGEEAGQNRSIELQAQDTEMLLVDWLHELVVALELEQMAFRDIKLEITDGRHLIGTVRAAPIVSIDKPIKAVTYNELHIQESPEGLETTIVFDV